MAKYTALMVVALLALAGANASRELKQGALGGGGLLGGVTNGLLGVTGGGSGSATGGNAGQGTNANEIGNNGGQANNGQANQNSVCLNSCTGNFLAAGCCANIGNIANNNNIKIVEFCNGNVDQCCILPIQDAVDAAVGVLGGAAQVENLVSDLTANLALFGSVVDNSNVKRCQ